MVLLSVQMSLQRLLVIYLLSKAEYDNIKDSIDACNRTLNYTRNYELCYFDYVSVDDDGWDKTQVPHSIIEKLVIRLIQSVSKMILGILFL